mmetsp:Transcript_15326/g.37626  ORF Transcript_15326/g.37626 Transcript_15326/m.37626 type:complete len:263 (+) Transcript_15326:1509-2297(+)
MFFLQFVYVLMELLVGHRVFPYPGPEMRTIEYPLLLSTPGSSSSWLLLPRLSPRPSPSPPPPFLQSILLARFGPVLLLLLRLLVVAVLLLLLLVVVFVCLLPLFPLFGINPVSLLEPRQLFDSEFVHLRQEDRDVRLNGTLAALGKEAHHLGPSQPQSVGLLPLVLVPTWPALEPVRHALDERLEFGRLERGPACPRKLGEEGFQHLCGHPSAGVVVVVGEPEHEGQEDELMQAQYQRIGELSHDLVDQLEHCFPPVGALIA